MEANPRVVFVGPAGTGKTILAIEAARRSSTSGRRVLLACYNRLLGKWLEEQTTSLHPGVTARTLHRHMLSVAQQSVDPDEAKTSTYWENELPATAIDRLLADDTDRHMFDELVIDEAPDILRGNYLDFLDLSLKGGLASGRWRMFGDFEKQAVYGSADLSLQNVLNMRTGTAPIYNLRANCRNTPRIAELVHLLGGLTPHYSQILRPDDGVEPELRHYHHENEQSPLLVKVLESLYSHGFTGRDIAILSPRGDVGCAAATIRNSPWKERLRPFAQASQGQMGYGSIRAFKGMEASAIIITDVSHITGPEATSLFYIAITRALHRLTILISDSVREEMLRVLVGSK
jgi:hypothetical protein